MNTFGTEYDYCSVMHYGVLDTACKITPIKNVACRIKDQDVTEIGQKLGLSELDVTAINKHYNCDGKYCCFHIKVVMVLSTIINTKPSFAPIFKIDIFAKDRLQSRAWMLAVAIPNVINGHAQHAMCRVII